MVTGMGRIGKCGMGDGIENFVEFFILARYFQPGILWHFCGEIFVIIGNPVIMLLAETTRVGNGHSMNVDPYERSNSSLKLLRWKIGHDELHFQDSNFLGSNNG